MAHLLIVDDNNPSRRATRGMFEILGYQVTDCASGEEALRTLAKDATISVCILDQKLSTDARPNEPSMDGIEALRKIRKEHPQVLSIMFTAAEDRGQEAIDAGATFYYYKPRLDPGNLATLVDALVKMQSLQRDKSQLQSIIDAMGVDVMVRDRDYRVILINKYKKDKCQKRWEKPPCLQFRVRESKCYDCFEPQTDGACRNDCPADEVFKTGKIVQKEHSAEDDHLLIIAGPIFRSDGTVDSVVEVCIDITRRKRASEAAGEIEKAAARPLKELGHIIVDQVHRIFEERIRLYVMNPDTDQLKGLASADLHRQRFDKLILEASDEQAEMAFSAAKPIVLSGNALLKDPCRAYLRNDGITQKIMVPLLSSGRRIGMLVIDNKNSQRSFDPEATDILALLTSAISESLRRSSELEEVNKQMRYLSAISRIDDQLVKAGRAQAVFDAVATELRSGFAAHSAWLLLRADAPDRLLTASHAGRINKDWVREGHPGNVGVVARCFKEGKTQIVSDAKKSDDFKALLNRIEHTAFRDYLDKISSVIAMPVIQGDTRVGACVLLFRKPPRFTEDDDRFLKEVAKRVAIALARIDDRRYIEAIAIERAKLSDLGLLGAGVAHALKNPLADALAALACLRDEAIPSVKGMEKLHQAEQAIMEAADLVRNLSKWARPQGIEPAEVDLKQIFEELQTIMGQRTEDRSINFQVKIRPSAQYVWGPPDALKMAFVDFLANAVTAMPKGGSLTVSARKDKDGKFVRLDVEDSGPGLPENVKRLLFEDGGGIESAPVGGIGLGLYLAKKVIASAGGTLAYEKRKTGGCRFIVRLPKSK